MYTAHVWHPDDTIDHLDTIDATRAAWQDPDVRLWIDLEEPTEEQLILLGALLGLHVDTIEDCLFGEQRPRIDEYDDHLFLVFYGVLDSDDQKHFSPRKLAVFVGERFLVTVHRQPLRTVKDLRQRTPRQIGQLLKRGVDHLLYTVVDGVVENYLVLAEHYEDRVEELEDLALDPSRGTYVLGEVSDVRREMLEVRRIVFAHRELLLPFAKGDYAYFSEALEDRFRHVVDHTVQALEMLDNLRELLRGVQDTHHSAVASQTNKVMKVLTIYASILLPMGVVVGLYGMNVPVWPSPDTPNVFWTIVGFMVVLAASMFGIFRYLKWL